MLHMLHAKETGARMIVVDPRFTRTAAKADDYVRIRSGTDIAFLFGMLYHIFKNGWEDKQYIHDRVYGMDKVQEEVMTKWTPDKVEEVTGVPEAQVYKVAEMMAKNRPSTLVWCMGQTQHTIGNAIVRASCIVQLALGNVGVSGGGANIFRGHDNVQGATDVGPNPDSLPGYYGIAAGVWKHFAAVWGVDYEWIKKQFASQAMMEKPGMTVSRWIDGVLEKNELIDQDPNLRAVVFWGHAPNSQTRGKEMVEAMKKLDLLVVIDPVSVGDRGDGGDGAQGRRVPAAGVHAVRDLGLGHRIEPLAAMARAGDRRRCSSRRPITRSCSQFAKKFGFDKELVKNYEIVEARRRREVRRADARVDPEARSTAACWTIGYTGQSPERLKLHMKNHGDLRREDAARQGRPLRRRLLRPAVAVLRHARDQASGVAEPLRAGSRASWTAAAASAPTSASSATASICWPRTARIPRAPSSPPAIPSSTTCC